MRTPRSRPTTPSPRPSAITSREPKKRVQRLHGHPAGRLQHHGPNDPGHLRCAGALRNGGPAGRRNCGSPRGLLYTSAQTDAALAAGLVPYNTTAQMNQAIADALLPYGTVAQRDAAIAAALAAYTSAQTDAAIAAAIAPTTPRPKHRGGAAEQRPDLERRADVQPAAGQQRAAVLFSLLPPPSSLLPPPSSLLLPPPCSLPPPPSSLLPPLPSSALPPPPKALKDGHGTTARAIRHARSPQRVRRRAQGFARHHSESAPTRPIPAEVRRRAIRHARSL